MRHWGFAVLSSLSCVLAGCSVLAPDDGGNSTEDNIAEYEQLRMSLEANRQEILPANGVDFVTAVGPYVLWLDVTQGWEAVLHIRRYPEGTEITSPVPIGDEATVPFYRASEELAMTALTGGSESIYRVIDLQTGELADEVSYAKPQAADYDAYGVYGNDAYLVVEDEGKMIYSWTAGSGTPAAIGAIDDTGANLGAWIDFTLVEYGGSLKLLALGTYGTYAIELDTMNATQIPLPVTPLEFGITDVGMAVVDGADLWFVGWGDSQARAIHDELKNSSYELNASFYNVHWVGSGGANIDVSMDGETIYYRSVAGIHSYNVNTNAIAPILLDDTNYSGSGLFIHYTGINVADNAMIVLGLESTDGATGADGPIYRVTL